MGMNTDSPDFRSIHELSCQSGHFSMHLAELKAKSPADLLACAEDLNIENASSLRKQDMMFAILKTLADNDQAIYGEGTLEIMHDGFGYLRAPESNYLPGPDDIYISPTQVRRFGLRTGDTVEGQIRAPRDGERYFSMLKINTINFESPDAVRHRINFDNLTPLYPERRLQMEVESQATAPEPKGEKGKKGAQKDFTPRVIDLVAPIGKGQRALIVAPPRTGKTVCCRTSPPRSANHPEVLPDRAADRRAARGSDRHAALREGRGDFLDLRRTGAPPRAGRRNGDRKGQAPGRAQARCGDPARFHHPSRPRLQHGRALSGKVLTGGVDANALQRPKRFFGAARNIEEGGSLTIIATALIDTGSRMDEVIFRRVQGHR
jgi:transcription termination factor Rho